MKRVRIVKISGLSRSAEERLRTAQREAGRCWSLCVEEHGKAREAHESWPGINELHSATKGGFALHSQSVQQIVRHFLGAVATTRKLRQRGDESARYPHREKRYFPVMWPKQAMAVYDKKVVLPMGRGRKSLVLPRPDGIPDEGAASKVVWNGVGYELHWVLESDDPPLVEGGPQSRRRPRPDTPGRRRDERR